ncbi:Ras-related protein Rab-15 [Chelonia mydas]|uniref:small monomeric GTPase n=1 Tax=Chelonia mydas TaxID=8469 RepID=M7AQU8_CHEMY|nr:Ras-related protein Rab-15 [Chelonia mydas]
MGLARAAALVALGLAANQLFSRGRLQDENHRSGWYQSANTDLGIFLVYDISSERSYQHIMKWASDVDEYAPDGVQKILIGNKADEEQKRQVGREQGLQLAKEYGMDFYETSACTNFNIKESFTRLTELVLQAHRKELDGLRSYAADELNLAELEEEECKPEGVENSPKACWC